MTRLTRPGIALAALLLVGAGCEEHEFHPPDRAARVAAAESAFSDTIFEDITWSSVAERINAGNLVYADECRRCHGAFGRGNTDYARERGLDVPSLVRPDWPQGSDVEALRHTIYVGHVIAMPSWGIGRLEPRQIDAAAFYIAEQLRAEMVGDTSTIPGG